jgi:hypothetical protein
MSVHGTVADPSATEADARDGADPSKPLTRTQAAEEAGLSERQRKTALRVASVPTEQCEAQVDSENPPTATQLAEQCSSTPLVQPFTIVSR